MLRRIRYPQIIDIYDARADNAIQAPDLVGDERLNFREAVLGWKNVHQSKPSLQFHQGQLQDKLLNDHLSFKEMEKIVKRAEKLK